MKIDLIVTRHPALVDYLVELNLVDENVEVLTHAKPENVIGKHVAGVLPHSLSCLTLSFTEIPLSLPPNLRGKELDLKTLRKFAGQHVTYKVNKV